MIYRDPIIEKLFDIIRAVDGVVFKSYYHGDPFLIPRANLPALICSKDNTRIGDASNAEDYHVMRLVFTVVTDIRTELGNPENDIVIGDSMLYDIFEGRNDDFSLKDTALTAILRRNTEIGNNTHIDLNSEMIPDYGFSFGKRGERSWAWEGMLTVDYYREELREA
jgi:hypothetical protein